MSIASLRLILDPTKECERLDAKRHGRVHQYKASGDPECIVYKPAEVEILSIPDSATHDHSSRFSLI